MTSEEHAWLRRIEEKIDKHTDALSNLTAHGCAQAPRHDDHEDRLRAVETWKAEMIGRVTLAGVLAGAAAGALSTLVPLLFHR